MIDYSVKSFLSVTSLALVHLWAYKAYALGRLWHTRFLSAAGGISVAYVFVDLLPKLSRGQAVIEDSAKAVFPYFNHHIYFLAFLGFIFFYGVDRSTSSGVKSKTLSEKWGFRISMATYVLFNFLIGDAVADADDPEVRPLALFTLAIGLHYFISDHNLRLKHKHLYDAFGRWILALSLYLGWYFGDIANIPEPIVALTVAFIAGGWMLNVLSYELPSDENRSYAAFCLGGIIYSMILSVRF